MSLETSAKTLELLASIPGPTPTTSLTWPPEKPMFTCVFDKRDLSRKRVVPEEEACPCECSRPADEEDAESKEVIPQLLEDIPPVAQLTEKKEKELKEPDAPAPAPEKKEPERRPVKVRFNSLKRKAPEDSTEDLASESVERKVLNVKDLTTQDLLKKALDKNDRMIRFTQNKHRRLLLNQLRRSILDNRGVMSTELHSRVFRFSYTVAHPVRHGSDGRKSTPADLYKFTRDDLLYLAKETGAKVISVSCRRHKSVSKWSDTFDVSLSDLPLVIPVDSSPQEESKADSPKSSDTSSQPNEEKKE
jgi:hypothetical protein